MKIIVGTSLVLGCKDHGFKPWNLPSSRRDDGLKGPKGPKGRGGMAWWEADNLDEECLGSCPGTPCFEVEWI